MKYTSSRNLHKKIKDNLEHKKKENHQDMGGAYYEGLGAKLVNFLSD